MTSGFNICLPANHPQQPAAAGKIADPVRTPHWTCGEKGTDWHREPDNGEWAGRQREKFIDNDKVIAAAMHALRTFKAKAHHYRRLALSAEADGDFETYRECRARGNDYWHKARGYLFSARAAMDRKAFFAPKESTDD